MLGEKHYTVEDKGGITLSMISFGHKGDFSKLSKYLENLKDALRLKSLEKYGRVGVDALSSATPIDSGTTSGSWYCEIEKSSGGYVINYCNSNINDGVPIAVILQMGHGTGTGGWVEGRDYINPAIQPVFDNIVNEAWKEVTSI